MIDGIKMAARVSGIILSMHWVSPLAIRRGERAIKRGARVNWRGGDSLSLFGGENMRDFWPEANFQNSLELSASSGD